MTRRVCSLDAVGVLSSFNFTANREKWTGNIKISRPSPVIQLARILKIQRDRIHILFSRH
jgi:hypothetical protein